MKKWDHGYVVGGRDDRGPFLLGSYRTRREAVKRFREALESVDWVAEYGDTLYVAHLVEERLNETETA